MAVPRQTIIIGVVAVAIGLLLGGIIGHIATPPNTLSEQDKDALNVMEHLTMDNWLADHDSMVQKIIDMVTADNIRENLREVSKKPHLAGTEQDNELAEMFRDRLLEAGFDTAELVPYNVLLSRPNASNPNIISLHEIAEMSEEIWRSHYKEEELHSDDFDEDFIHAFNSYTPAASVETAYGTGVVYVNYGRVEDFELLDDLGVNVSGHVVMARYGKIFRGNKIKHAEQWGAIGVILYSDPADVAGLGQDPENVYPNTEFLPGTGMQRGSTLNRDGDPLTPGWPSTENAYRISYDEADLPKIPAQPIGYDDAKIILEKLDGIPAPLSWVGKLDNVSYNLGPSWTQEFSNLMLKLETHNTLDVYTSYNVIGTIKGDVEPDRYVLIGNHRDAWGYGAIDPSSGTAALLETARVLGQLKKEGWRPRRTIVFCSWGAEEYGMIGSTEWVEEHLHKLQERATAYINSDICSDGPALQAKASPMLWKVLQEVVKKVPGVRSDGTLYDEWAAWFKQDQGVDAPVMKTLGSGSDHAPFAFYAGIPALDFSFKYDQYVYNVTSGYATYHTGYETFYLVDEIIDKGFKIHQGCSRLTSLTLKYLSDSVLLPYSVEELPKAMDEALNGLNNNKNSDILSGIYDKYPLLQEAVKELISEAERFTIMIQENMTNMDPISVRSYNDLMMHLEQVFIIPEGLRGRPHVRHAVFSPSQFDSYAAAAFPGITDLLYDMDKLSNDDLVIRHKEISKHISDLTIMVYSAINMLKEMHHI